MLQQKHLETAQSKTAVWNKCLTQGNATYV